MTPDRIRMMVEAKANSTVKAQNNPILAYDADPKSRAKAVKAMCAQCMGCTRDEIAPGFRDQVRDCTSQKCALYRFRPYQKKVHSDD